MESMILQLATFSPEPFYQQKILQELKKSSEIEDVELEMVVL